MSLTEQEIIGYACPKCHSPVQLAPDKSSFVCSRCQVAYPIQEDIPHLIYEESIPWQ